ncbi:VanW family protein [Risungbinella massiliensis]|uniref:VanW family protein n=1 Tax=Risungbinella massiliensis TaxID=1329796 RepID=UPI00069C905C|nr:VanW family protein [Risungbinella massiliensis]
MLANIISCLSLMFFFNPPIPNSFHFTYQDQHWYVPYSTLGFDGVDPTTISPLLWDRWIQKEVVPKIEWKAQDAKFLHRKMVAHRLGNKIDRTKTWENLYTSTYQTIPIYTYSVRPKLSYQQLKRLKQKKLGEYTTYFQQSNENRTRNLELSSCAIDHKVVMPNEIFSFNQTVGMRTTQKGYRFAKIIVKGEYSEGVGGGICQTSSTLFNAADKAGLRIIQQISHSRSVPYVPKGRDATVSWGGPDFQFQNNRPTPILIVSDIMNGVLHISIYGENDNQF